MSRRAWVTRAAAAGSVIAMSLVMAACGSSSSSSSSQSDDSGSFTVLVYGDATNKVEQAMVDQFNKTSKVKAKLQTIPGADYQQKLQTIISTKQAPDVFFNWGGGSIAPFVKAGLLQPLDDMEQSNPALKSDFLSSVFNTAVIDGHSYGIPMRGTQPVLLFSNKKVLKAAGITSEPATFPDLINDVKTLEQHGVKSPIALGGGDQWPTLMWFEYMFDRVAGPDLFQKALNGDTSVWSSQPAQTALGDLKQLIDLKAFGNNFDSVKFTDNGESKLLATGKAGFELMGSWDYSTLQSIDKNFVNTDLGYGTFPTVPGGAGDPKDIVGNTNNFYSVKKGAAHLDAIAKFLTLMYSDDFVKDQLAIGNLPTTTNTQNFLSTAASPAYDTFQYNLVKAAPSFTLSWDQAFPQADSTAIHTAVADFFDGKIDAKGFASAMSSLPQAAG